MKGAVWGQRGGKVEVEGGSVGATRGQGGSMKGAVWGQ